MIFHQKWGYIVTHRNAEKKSMEHFGNVSVNPYIVSFFHIDWV